MSRELKTVRLYACGGAGANIAQLLLPLTKDQLAGVANLEIAFTDTSNSDLTESGIEDKVYLLEGLDGSGQKRNLHSSEIVPVIKNFIGKFAPADLNIVLSSLSGGSGSVFAPLITKELLSKDVPVISMGIGDYSSVLRGINTINTLKSYEAVSQQVNKPVILSYFFNEDSKSIAEVNKYVTQTIKDLLVLFSGQNKGLDSQDLLHWLQYDRVTEVPPALSCLAVLGKDEIEDKTYGAPISVATLSPYGEPTDYNGPIEYHCEGNIPQKFDGEFYKEPTHFAICDGLFVKAITTIQEKIDHIKEVNGSRIKRKSLLSKDDDVDNESGLIF